MMILVSGGSGSGKSEVAENLAVKISQGGGLVYLATMQPFGKESLKRIERHKALRHGKGFSTMEVYRDVHSVALDGNTTVLLECLSNLLANESFSDTPCQNVTEKVLQGIKHLKATTKNLVVVSNEVFSDGYNYEPSTMEYIRNLGKINCELAKLSDVVIECVCGNAIVYKGSLSPFKSL